MTESQITRAEQDATGINSNLARVLQYLSARASALEFMATGAMFLAGGAAALLWLLCFASFCFDSFKSFLVCFMVLFFLSLPGAYFYWLRRLLQQLSALPALLASLGKVGQAELKAAAKALRAEEEGVAENWYEKAWVKMDAVLELRARILGYRDDLLDVAEAAPLIAILCHPATGIVTLVAASSAVLIAIAAVLALVWTLLSVIF